jgi:hypothetical protein
MKELLASWAGKIDNKKEFYCIRFDPNDQRSRLSALAAADAVIFPYGKMQCETTMCEMVVASQCKSMFLSKICFQ